MVSSYDNFGVGATVDDDQADFSAMEKGLCNIPSIKI